MKDLFAKALEVARSYNGLLRLGSMGCDGSGILLGSAAGGKTDLMGNLFIGSPLSPPLAYVKGGYTNAKIDILATDNTTDLGTNLKLDGWRAGAG